jgi:multiple sugar transport system substrate-binding protein
MAAANLAVPVSGAGPTSRLSRRRVLGAGASGTMAILAAACGPQPAGQTAPRAAMTQPFRLLWQIRTTPGYDELVKWGIEQFKKQYPNATVDTTLDAGNVEKTLTLMVAGDGPDVFHGWGHVMWQYAAKGQMYNHNDLVKDWKKADIDDFAEFQWRGFIIPTTNFRFGLPTYINMMVLYYNRTLFQKRGQKEPTVDWNHDDYALMLKQMTFQDGATKVWGGWIPAASFDRFQNHVLMFGGHVVDPKDLRKTQLDTPQSQAGLEWMRARLWADQTLAPLAGDRRTWQPNDQWNGFYQGAVATLEDGMHNFQNVARNMTAADWDIAHVPKGPASAGGKRAVLGTTDGWALWKGTKVKDQAWDLMKLITGKEWFDQQATLTGLIPSRKSSLETWVKVTRERWLAGKNVNLKVVTDALTVMNYPTVDEIFLCQAEAARVIGPALNAVFRDGEKPVTYFRDIKAELEQAAGSCGIDPQQVFK